MSPQGIPAIRVIPQPNPPAIRREEFHELRDGTVLKAEYALVEDVPGNVCVLPGWSIYQLTELSRVN